MEITFENFPAICENNAMKSFKTPSAIIVFLLFATGANSGFAQTNMSMADKIARVIAEHESNYPAQIWTTGATSSLSATDAPSIPKSFQRNISRAWAASGEGKSPTNHCSGFFNGMGVRLANDNTEASDLRDSMQAIDICYVGVVARFLAFKLEQVKGADYNCLGEMTVTHNHRLIATSLLRDADPQGMIVAYLDGRLDNVVGKQVRDTCPKGVVSSILPIGQ